MNYNFFIIFHEFKPLYWQKRFKRDLDYFKKLCPPNTKLTILDLTKYCLVKSKNFYDHEDKDVKYIKIKSLNELKKILLMSQKNYALGPVFPTFNSIFVFIIMNIFKLKIVMINRQGFFLNIQSNKLTLLNSLKFFLNHKLLYIFTRILSSFSVFPKIEYYFETSQIRINQINNSMISKLKKLTNNKINLSFVRNIIRINSSSSDEVIINTTNAYNQKNIVVIDSGYDHPDRFSREVIKINDKYKNDRNIYYKKLLLFLKDLSNLTNKKVVFCKHPKNKYPKDGYFNEIENSFCNDNYFADKEIRNADITIFTGGSSMINKSIIFNKNIIILRSRLIGIHNILLDSFTKQITLKEFDLDNQILDKNDNIIEECKKIKQNYMQFVDNNLIKDKNTKSYDQIKSILYK